MAASSPARLIAPLALVTCAVALAVVVTRADSGESPTRQDRPASTEREQTQSTRTRERSRSAGPRSYVVKAGDTPSAIAERTGVTLERILTLNPDIDPQTLSTGTRLRLRP